MPSDLSDPSDCSDSENRVDKVVRVDEVVGVDGNLVNVADCGRGRSSSHHYGAVRSAMHQLQRRHQRQVDTVKRQLAAEVRQEEEEEAEEEAEADEEAEDDDDDDEKETTPCGCMGREQSVRRLELKIDRLEKRLLLTEELLRLKCQSEPKEHEFMEFFFAEMEKNQSEMDRMARRVDHLLNQMQQMQCQWRHQQQQHVKSQQKQDQAVKTMQLLVESDQLRQEAKAMTVQQHQRQLKSVRQFVQQQVADCRLHAVNQLAEMRVALQEAASEREAAQLESLASHRKELREELEMVAAMCRSNKKTIRVLTDEIVKIKRNAMRPADHETQLLLDKFQFPKPTVAHSATAS